MSRRGLIRGRELGRNQLEEMWASMRLNNAPKQEIEDNAFELDRGRKKEYPDLGGGGQLQLAILAIEVVLCSLTQVALCSPSK